MKKILIIDNSTVIRNVIKNLFIDNQRIIIFEANSKEELLDKIKNIEWDSIKPEDNKIGSRFDFSI